MTTFLCDECDNNSNSFSSVEALLKHVIKCHIPERLQCDDCGKTLSSSRNDVANHFKIVHLKGHKSLAVQCYECEKIFPAMKHLLRHVLVHHLPRRAFKCDKCQKKWLNLQSMKNHCCQFRKAEISIQPASVKALFKCDVCSKTCASRKGLLFHSVRSHSNTQIDFSKMNTEKNRLRTDGRQTFIKCSQCSAWLTNGEDLQAHERRHEEAATSRQRCRFCNHICPDRKLLRIHERSCCKSSNGNRFACSACEKIFSKSADLQRHGKTAHSKYIFFQCDVCDKICRTKNELTSHAAYAHVSTQINHGSRSQLANKIVKVRGGRAVLQCSKCVKTFVNAGNLRRHELQHVNIRTIVFPCSTCNRSFANKTNLNLHAMTHDNGRAKGVSQTTLAKDDKKKLSFVCDLCGAVNRSFSKLALHIFLTKRLNHKQFF